MKARVAQLDGLRGLAILLVLAGHARGVGLPFGGAIGVTLFFVLSGYLITGLLVRELRERGTVSLRGFWLRRVRRLAPAMLVFLPAAAVLKVVIQGEPPWLLWQMLAWVPVSNVSRGLGIQEFWPLGHLWSLAVEEQFYLLWPAVVGLLWARTRLPRAIGLLLAAVVAWRALVLLAGFTDWAYFGPDTNAFALVAGALLAVLPSGRHPDHPLRRRSPSAVVTALALLVLIALAALPPGTPALWMELPAALLAVVIVAGAPSLAVLGAPPLRFLGRISYGLYLWHPLFVSESRPALLNWVGCAVAVVIAALSFYGIESIVMGRRDGARKTLVTAESREVATALR